MKTKIIAEVGANHNGDIELAKTMIQTAAACGVDYVKFQSWQADRLKPGDPNYDRHKKAELSDDDHRVLIAECRKNNVKFLTTCFDWQRIEFLASLGLDTIKIASPDLTSARMIQMLRQHFKHLIVSTGMSTVDEVRATANLLKGTSFTLLHCVSLYPTPPERVNLARMDWLKQFTPSVGYSDHTMGTKAALLAIGRGAAFIEKHFTSDRNLPGKDQQISGIPSEFTEICDFARAAEVMIGTDLPELTAKEQELRTIYQGKWGDNR